MGKDILMIIISCTITFIMSTFLGFVLGKLKQYKKRDQAQEEALKCLLRSTITSKYYVYKKMGYVPRFERENVNYMYAQYKAMEGNSYIDVIIVDFNELPMKEEL